MLLKNSPEYSEKNVQYSLDSDYIQVYYNGNWVDVYHTKLQFDGWFYNNGTFSKRFSGFSSPESPQQMTITNNAKYITVTTMPKTLSTQNSGTKAYSKNLIDLKNVNKIVVEVNSKLNIPNTYNVVCLINESKTERLYGTENHIPSSGKHSIEINTANITGKWYMLIESYNNSYSSDNNELTIYSIYGYYK